MRIDEVFTDAYPYKWNRKSTKGNFDDWDGAFKANDGSTVELYISCLDEDENYWYVSFVREHDSKFAVLATGQGDAVKVMSTIVKMLQEFDVVMEPYKIKFTTHKGNGERETTSRPKLYRAIVKSLGKHFSVTERDVGSQKVFILTRNI